MNSHAFYRTNAAQMMVVKQTFMIMAASGSGGI